LLVKVEDRRRRLGSLGWRELRGRDKLRRLRLNWWKRRSDRRRGLVVVVVSL